MQRALPPASLRGVSGASAVVDLWHQRATRAPAAAAPIQQHHVHPLLGSASQLADSHAPTPHHRAGGNETSASSAAPPPLGAVPTFTVDSLAHLQQRLAECNTALGWGAYGDRTLSLSSSTWWVLPAAAGLLAAAVLLLFKPVWSCGALLPWLGGRRGRTQPTRSCSTGRDEDDEDAAALLDALPGVASLAGAPPAGLDFIDFLWATGAVQARAVPTCVRATHVSMSGHRISLVCLAGAFCCLSCTAAYCSLPATHIGAPLLSPPSLQAASCSFPRIDSARFGVPPNAHPGDRVLHLGCGDGALTKLLFARGLQVGGRGPGGGRLG